MLVSTLKNNSTVRYELWSYTNNISYTYVRLVCAFIYSGSGFFSIHAPLYYKHDWLSSCTIRGSSFFYFIFPRRTFLHKCIVVERARRRRRRRQGRPIVGIRQGESAVNGPAHAARRFNRVGYTSIYTRCRCIPVLGFFSPFVILNVGF